MILNSQEKLSIFFSYIKEHNSEIIFAQYDEYVVNEVIYNLNNKQEIEILAEGFILGYYMK